MGDTVLGGSVLPLLALVPTVCEVDPPAVAWSQPRWSSEAAGSHSQCPAQSRPVPAPSAPGAALGLSEASLENSLLPCTPASARPAPVGCAHMLGDSVMGRSTATPTQNPNQGLDIRPQALSLPAVLVQVPRGALWCPVAMACVSALRQPRPRGCLLSTGGSGTGPNRAQ